MSETVADRYARAILEVGEERGNLERLAADIQALAATYEASAELRATLSDPLLNEATRTRVVQALVARVGACPEALNSLRVMMRRHRLNELPAVAARLAQLADERSGLLRVVVCSAKPLSDAYYTQLSREIEQTTGRKVAIDKQIDETLIAGVLLHIGARTIDGSLKGRLDEFERNLAQAS